MLIQGRMTVSPNSTCVPYEPGTSHRADTDPLMQISLIDNG